jgi:hypothetical protein
MQRCCDIPERPTMFEEINATYPECYQEYSEGKTKTAGYTAGL